MLPAQLIDFNHAGPLAVAGAGQRCAQLRFIPDRLRGTTQGLGHTDKVRGVDVHANRLDGAIEHVFLDLAVALVVPQQHDDRRLRLHCAGQFGQGKLQAAITDQAQHRAAGLALGATPQPGPHCRGQGVAERAIARG